MLPEPIVTIVARLNQLLRAGTKAAKKKHTPAPTLQTALGNVPQVVFEPESSEDFMLYRVSGKEPTADDEEEALRDYREQAVLVT